MSDEPRHWVLVTNYDGDVSVGRVDLDQCELWVESLEQRFHSGYVQGSQDLYRTPGGGWLVYSWDRDRLDGSISERAWRPLPSEVVEWFLRRPKIEPPADLMPALDQYDVTDAPPPEPPARPEAPAVNPAPTPSMPPEAPAVDFAALATALRFHGRGKSKQARLVEHLSGKDHAEAEEIADRVHGDERTTEKGIRSNVGATNASLEAMGSRLRFEMRGSVVRRVVLPE